MKKNETANSGFPVWPLIALVVLILGLCIGFGFTVSSAIEEGAKRGQFGDMFGALNSFFSGAAFAGVVYAIFLQRRDLQMQFEEMQLSRQGLSAQNEMIALQLKAMKESYEMERAINEAASVPKLVFRSSTGGSNYRNFKFINVGGRIMDVSVRLITPEKGLAFKTHIEIHVWNSGDIQQFDMAGFGGGGVPACHFELLYTDMMGRSKVQGYSLEGSKIEELP